MEAEARSRLQWQCRRGLLELDIVLQRFLQANGALGEDDLAKLHQLLDFPDNDLWDIVIGRSQAFEPHLAGVVARLRAHGAELVGEVVQYEDSYRLCYVRSPEGFIVALAEQLS